VRVAAASGGTRARATCVVRVALFNLFLCCFAARARVVAQDFPKDVYEDPMGRKMMDSLVKSWTAEVWSILSRFEWIS